MKDIESIADIKIFVDGFYEKVQHNGLLGPVFFGAITGDWQPHLDKMYAFWNAALFGIAGFKGNPFAKHASLRIGDEHFGKWLELFNETIDAHFEGPVAEDAKNRAVLMAKTFIGRLGNMPNGSKSIIV